MEATEQIKQINSMYDRLHFINNYRMVHYRDKIFDLSRKSEKEHRGYDRTPETKAFTLSMAAKLFTVQYILEGMIAGLKSRKRGGPSIPMTSIHGLRYEYLYGRSVGADYCREISKKISSREAKEYLSSIDYCDLM